MKGEGFVYKKIKNCRRFVKYYYTLDMNVDSELVSHLANFGLVNTNSFSQHSPHFKDTFTVRLEDEIEIAGTYQDKQVYLTLGKNIMHLKHEIESIFSAWIKTRSRD